MSDVIDRKYKHATVSNIKKALGALYLVSCRFRDQPVDLQAALIRLVPLILREEVGVFLQGFAVLTCLLRAHLYVRNTYGVRLFALYSQ